MIKNIIEKYKNMPIAMRASIFFIICSFMQKSISIITSPIFTRLLTTKQYGIYVLYNSWFEILSVFVTLKLTEAVFNKSMIDTEDQERRKVLSSYQLLLTILSLLFLGIYLLLNKNITSLIGLSNLFMISLLINIFFDGTIKLWMAYKKFEYKYVSFIIVSLIISILNPTLGILLVINLKNKVFGRILGIVLVSVIVGSVLYIYNIKKINIQNFKKISIKLLIFNIPLLPHYLSQILLNHADRIMIGKYLNEDKVALYSVAYTIGMLVTLITQSINNAYVPTIFRFMKNKTIDKLQKYNKNLLILVSLTILIIFLIAPELVLLFGGKKYILATKCVYPIAASVLFMFIYSLFANIEIYYGIRKYITLGTCFSAILNIILNIIFIKLYGYQAAAYTTLICYILNGMIHIFISKKLIEKNEKIKVDFAIKKIFILSIVLIILSLIFSLFLINIIVRYLLVLLIILLILKLISKGSFGESNAK